MKELARAEIDLIIDAKGDGLTDLPEDALEKDLHLSEILVALAGNELSSDLVFCGGTALAKAHLAVNRMSEDVDFKYLSDPGISKHQSGKALKALVGQIDSLIKKLGFATELHAQDGGNFRTIAISFSSAFPRSTALRENIKFEITASTPVLPTQVKSIRTFLYSAVGQKDFGTQLNCISIEETLLEKVSVFLRKNHPKNYLEHFDQTLIRHIYDCDQIKAGVNLNTETDNAFREILRQDFLRYSNQFPSQSEDVENFLLESLDAFLGSTVMSSYYSKFVEELVIGPSHPFEIAKGGFVSLAETLIRKLN